MEINAADLDNLEKEINPDIVNNEREDDKTSEAINNTIEITPTQQEITKKIAVIDSEIATLSKVTINEDEFYENLDEFLTDEDRYLQEENPKEYLKIVDKKKKEYIASKSNNEEIAKKQEERNNLQYEADIEDGIRNVTKTYKDYNHQTSANFFATKLSKEQQEEIYKKSTTVGDVFKLTHEKYLELNGKKVEVKNTPAPATVNLNNITQSSLKNKDILAIDSEDEKYKKALGV
jgi:hypothetical protein